MPRLVEFKIQNPDISRWEDTPVSFTLDLGYLTWDAVTEYCDDLAAKIVRAEKRTVRWERKGVGQGHYTTPWSHSVNGG